MQVQRVQKNNTYFSAKLVVNGWTDDLSPKTLKSWNRKAEAIGSETDIITLNIGQPKDINYNDIIRLMKTKETRYKYSRLLYRFGIDYYRPFRSKRNICASFKQNNTKEIVDNCGYSADYSNEVSAEELKKWHQANTIMSINDYLKKLKNNYLLKVKKL